MKTVLERFLRYVKFDTKSDEESTSVPSTFGQKVLAGDIVAELNKIGLKSEMDDKGYIYGSLDANLEKDIKTIGFIAHMDTSPDMTGKSVNPKIIENYNGEDIILDKENDILLSKDEFPELLDYVGNDIITTDGKTLLGADDKAGIAEIITAMEYLIEHPEIKHGNIKIGFTPDEEVGRGADYFDVEKFGADFAYTVDGGKIGELEYENFNAASAKIKIIGRNVHPGSAKNKMINSSLVANEILNQLPKDEVPEKTERYEGFFHLLSIKGDVEQTNLSLIIRDFDRDEFEERKNKISNIIEEINKKYGKKIATVEIKDQYYNMKELVEKESHIVDTAFEAMKAVGVEPNIIPIRGGTDGARLSFMGLLTPNLFAGGENFHGRYEFLPVQSMEKSVETILKIIELYTEK
ncbi:MAG: peptidase T [Clostridiaceae bacterium]